LCGKYAIFDLDAGRGIFVGARIAHPITTIVRKTREELRSMENEECG
jgi:hypothetical protein